MSAVQTGADAVRAYLTGAASDGGVQRDPALSLGGYRSRERVYSCTYRRVNPIHNLVVEFVSGGNPMGLGLLQAYRSGGVDYLRWAPAGVSLENPAIQSVAIAAGETQLIKAVLPGHYLIVRRPTSDAIPSGTETIQIMPTLNNVIGMDNIIYPTPWQYRAIMLRNEGSQALNNVGVSNPDYVGGSPVRYDNHIEIRWAAPDENGAIPALTDAWTDPGLGSWYKLGLSSRQIAASLAPGESIGLYIRTGPLTYGKYYPTKNATAFGDHVRLGNMTRTLGLHWDFTLQTKLVGVQRIGNEALHDYLVFVGIDEEPSILQVDYKTGWPDAEFDEEDLPYTLTGVFQLGKTHYIRVVRQNVYGVRDAIGQLITVPVSAEGELDKVPPNGPSLVQVTPVGEGKFEVIASYDPQREGETKEDQLAYAATRWAVYTAVGEDPDPDVVVPVTEDMRSGLGPRLLEYTTATGCLEGAEVHVLVRTQRNDGSDTAPYWVESTNTDVYTAEAVWFGPHRVKGGLAFGDVLGVYQQPVSVSETVFIDQAKNIYWEVLDGETRLWADTVLVWNLRWIGTGDNDGLYTTLAFQEAAISGSQSAAVEVGTWDAGAKELHFAVAGTRLMTVDVVAGTLKCSALSDHLEVNNTYADEPLWQKVAATCLQVYAEHLEQYRTGASLDADGVLRLGVPWRQKLTQEECL